MITNRDIGFALGPLCLLLSIVFILLFSGTTTALTNTLIHRGTYNPAVLQEVQAWIPYLEQDPSGTQSWCVSSSSGEVLQPFIAMRLPDSTSTASALPTTVPTLAPSTGTNPQ